MHETYAIEPELTGPAPRQVFHRRRGLNSGLGCLRVFLIPFIVIGIGFALAFAGNVVFRFANQKAEGRIVGKQIVPDSDGGDTYYVDYTYRVEDDSFQKRDTVNQELYSRAEFGQSVQVAYLSVHPGLYSLAMLPGRSFVRHVGFILLFGLFWNGIVAVFVYVAFIAPYVERRLYRIGTSSAGVISGKTTRSGEDSSTYLIEYEFASGEGTPRVKGKTAATLDEWNRASVGDPLTILFDPNKPKRNVAYRYGSY